ncbi:sigma-54 interaction domain-containing protein [Effusibacillus lacus]|uniref:Fis family transcriptional regulator n=1 Tax=Effusibacillus lacus TaxID=1348429 RepID=A0A292YPN2_9BACL|nr:sigma 54-interacting transcriptional regulator [Effusibacillus lacus]TCS72570.1 PAS domain S-box-containing protein [Effusibacillus lacus]GAX90871.1 Fis family transcriptional regulator [Effusibacillus lacus]
MQTIQTFFTDFVVVENPIRVKEALAIVRKNQARLLVLQKGEQPIGICDSHSVVLQTDRMSEPVVFSTEFKIINQNRMLCEADLAFPYVLIQNEDKRIVGWLDNAAVEIQCLKENYSQDLRDLTTDLEAIVDSIYDEILVVDARGNILRVSNRSANNMWGVNLSTVIGQNMLELEERGWFKPSVTRMVIEQKKKISVIQENRFGQKILAVGNPIFNRKKQLERIVIASRDITEVTKLEHELRQERKLTEKYRKEIDSLRKLHKIDEKTIIFQSNRMQELMSEVERVAGVESTVTLYGESGVGKELIAHAIHHLSARADRPFVKINCGSIPENLLESELFGYEKGAFTGALSEGKKGFFELADNGTLFLDEVAELPLNLQVKLLRAIQEREIMKVGGSRPVPINVRIITATNKNLEEMVWKGTFREDLFYRLHVIPLYVPALRERIEDIESLVYYFLDFFNRKFSSKKHFSEDALELLKAYHWPGNVRQLQNVIERAMVVTASQLITANELNKILGNRNTGMPPVQVNTIIPLQHAVELTEQQLIQMALSQYKTITKVAEVLEVSQPTISRRYQKLFTQVGNKS